VSAARPGIMDQKGRFKWDAWHAKKGKIDQSLLVVVSKCSWHALAQLALQETYVYTVHVFIKCVIRSKVHDK
jgi:hypothetical protein